MKCVSALLIAFATLALAPAAMACSPALVFPRPGETVEQAYIRRERENQERGWHDASAVYLARVVRIDVLQNRGKAFVFQPVADLRGQPGPSRIVEQQFDSGCGGYQWAVGDVAIVYARRISRRDSLRRWGDWLLLNAVPPHHVRDERIVAALRAYAARHRVD